MTDQKHKLEKAWKYLAKKYRDGTFKPIKEADIQCFLYHALISKKGGGIPVKKIHAEYRYSTKKEGKQRADIKLGGGKRRGVYIEIKKTVLKPKHESNASDAWKEDIRKSIKRKLGNRKPVLLIFASKGKKRVDIEKVKKTLRKFIRKKKKVTILGCVEGEVVS